MFEKTTEALLVTPLLPMNTGLATYAMRVLGSSSDFIDWTVAYPQGSDPETLPDGMKSIPIDRLETGNIPAARIFQIGNSTHCFPVVQALYKFGGTVLLHETVLHHMLRYCYLESNRVEEYRRELKFCFGPSAEIAEKELSDKRLSVMEYDIKLKNYPLIGRVLNSAHSAVCLNSYAASILSRSFPEGRVITIGHPLSKLPPLETVRKPYPVCFGMIGTNHPGRNLDSVIEAVALLRKEIPDSGLLLVGSGYPEELPEWVTATGRLDEREYQSWIRTLDYVFDVRYPTCGETSGSLLEAMRAGIPAVVTAAGPFINMPSDALLRVPHDSIVQGIRSAVLLLEENSELRQSISEKAVSYALAEGSESRLLEDWKRILRLAQDTQEGVKPDFNSTSLSPAWHEPPEGFTRNLITDPVTWEFSGNAKIEGPENSSGALVTVWGEGTAGDIELESKPSVLRIDDNVIHFRGIGWVSNVLWE